MKLEKVNKETNISKYKILSVNYTDFVIIFQLKCIQLVKVMKIKLSMYSLWQKYTEMRVICLLMSSSKVIVNYRLSSEIQDGRQDGRHEVRQNEALGQYFEMGTYKFVY